MNEFLVAPNTIDLKLFHTELMQWFDANGRHHLPWKPQDIYSDNQNIYHIWLSEIMLQQTQVTTVIPYFFNFIEKFPTCNDLANAPLDEVLKAWEGLGYYARAKNLHQGAQIVRDQFNGIIPMDYASIQLIKGIGRTTASAIISQGFNRPFAILDGNVKRVMARVTGAMHPEKQLEKILLPFAYLMAIQDRPNDYTQAIMDFGATLCSKSPQCIDCFWQNNCVTKQYQKMNQIPAKKIKLVKKNIELYPVIIRNQHDELIFHHRLNESIWHNLYEFPHLESHLNEVETLFTSDSIKVIQTEELTSFKHLLTHINFEVTPLLITVESTHPTVIFNNQEFVWKSQSEYQAFAKTKPTNDILLLL